MKILSREDKDKLIELFKLKEEIDRQKGQFDEEAEDLKKEFEESLKVTPLKMVELYEKLSELLPRETKLAEWGKKIHEDALRYNEQIEAIVNKDVSYLDLLKLILAS